MVLALGDREHLGVSSRFVTRGDPEKPARSGTPERRAAAVREGPRCCPQHRVYGFLQGLLASRLEPRSSTATSGSRVRVVRIITA